MQCTLSVQGRNPPKLSHVYRALQRSSCTYEKIGWTDLRQRWRGEALAENTWQQSSCLRIAAPKYHEAQSMPSNQSPAVPGGSQQLPAVHGSRIPASDVHRSLVLHYKRSLQSNAVSGLCFSAKDCFSHWADSIMNRAQPTCKWG